MLQGGVEYRVAVKHTVFPLGGLHVSPKLNALPVEELPEIRLQN